MRQLEWSYAARQDLSEAARYIAADSPKAAFGLELKVRKAGDDLAFMATGRKGRNGATYEKLVTGTPYILVYTIRRIKAAEIVYVLRLIHSARDWTPGGWPK
jgi:toxin ParE1/3/4